MEIKKTAKKNLLLVSLIGILCGAKYIESRMPEDVWQRFLPRQVEFIPEENPAQYEFEIPKPDSEYEFLLLHGNPFDKKYHASAGTFDEYQD